MKIPKQAKRVFKGGIFDIYHWPQRMYDGTVVNFEMARRPGAVQVIAVQGDKIMICKQKQPNHHKYYYSLFGGRMDPGETPLQAAKRELLEESGLKSNNWKFLKMYNPHFKIDWPIYFYVAHNCQKMGKQNLDNGEIIEPLTISFVQFIDLVLNKKFFCTDFAFDMAIMKLNGKLNHFKNKLFTK